ncbi:MAG TPA: hydantoinase B/oxoprolinase family protein [Burkholderiales bacterium]|jgi:N-methylhydantoinase B
MSKHTLRELGIDPITFEVLRNGLDAIADEMAYTIVRSARSTMIKDCMDYSASLCTANGELIAQAVNIPVMMCSTPDALRPTIAKFGKDLAPGDCLILSDPYEGGSHLPDIFMFMPIFHEGRLIAFSSTCAHHVDVGGMAPGSASTEATEIFQEGLRIPIVKLYERGVPNSALYELVLRNVRFPSMLQGDLEAQRSACMIGERQVKRLVERYGADTVVNGMQALLDYSERLCREEILKMPNGTYEFVDYIDEDGMDPDPIPIRLKLTISGDRVIADFSESAPQVRGSLNCSLSVTKASTFTAVKCFCRTPFPPNSGFFRPIEVIAPEGSVVNVAFPGATFMRGLTIYRINNVLFGALARAMPERAIAADEGGTSIVLMEGEDRNRERFIYMETISGAWGGRATLDGIDTASNITGLQSNTPVEVLETEYPIEVVQYGYVPNSGGAGRYRGGLGLVREYRYTAERGTLQMRADRVKYAPYGIYGGKPGGHCRNVYDPYGANITLESKVKNRPIRRGDVIRHIMAGGGGYGWPFDRDIERVVRDVRDEKVSIEAAREEYGVVIDPGTLLADHTATQNLRAQLRARVDPAHPPMFTR